MEHKSISPESQAIINSYKNWTLGPATCSIPYFNNRHLGLRGGLPAEVGKGSPEKIREEAEHIAFIKRIDVQSFTNESLKHFLVDYSLGVDCSAFVYYVLNAEDHLTFPYAEGLFRKFRAKTQPVKNADVKTFAHEKNSKIISLQELQPGDIITMIHNEISRNHIIVITEVDYENSKPRTIHYAHSIAWPLDGVYGHGVREGTIEIMDLNKPIQEQQWIENGKTGNDNHSQERARESTTETRRLHWF